MRGDDGVFVFSISHIGQKGVCLLFFEFCEEIQNCLLGRSPLGPPDTPNFEKFGEVVEVIILLYYLGCRY